MEQIFVSKSYTSFDGCNALVRPFGRILFIVTEVLDLASAG